MDILDGRFRLPSGTIPRRCSYRSRPSWNYFPAEETIQGGLREVGRTGKLDLRDRRDFAP